jgi:hypothetical protein
MARHRFDEVDDGVRWGGPKLLEGRDTPPHRHARDRRERRAGRPADDARFASCAWPDRPAPGGTSPAFRPPVLGNLVV